MVGGWDETEYTAGIEFSIGGTQCWEGGENVWACQVVASA